MHLCVFEDQNYSNFFPLVCFRPVYDLRCGILTLREKIEALLPRSTTALLVRQELSGLCAEEHPRIGVNSFPGGDCWFVNGRVLADSRLAGLLRQRIKETRVFRHGDVPVAAFVRSADISRIGRSVDAGIVSAATFSGFPVDGCECTILTYPWELVHGTAREIDNDLSILKKSKNPYKKISGAPRGVHLVNKSQIYTGKNCTIKPGAVLDASGGCIVLGNNVTMMPNSVIEGPAFIGDGSIVKIGAKLYHGTSAGRQCKVGGEIESSVLQSFSNKQHDGFLGHSYLSSWINIGAGTNNSDLKNTYGSVKVSVNGTMVDTKSLFVGLLMGDHAKAGIATMFNSGTVVGVSCNAYGAGFQPKVLPSFSWGEPGAQTEYNLERALSTARKMMARRNVEMTPAYERVFRNLHMVSSDERSAAGINRTA